MNALKAALFALALIVSSSALARAPVPVVDIIDQPIVTASGNTLTVEQVQHVIRLAADKRNWVVTPQPDGKMVASLSWKENKHTIVVNIAAASDRYSITYNSSVNMKYAAQDGQPVIHPYYNKFVAELREAIRGELMKY